MVFSNAGGSTSAKTDLLHLLMLRQARKMRNDLCQRCQRCHSRIFQPGRILLANLIGPAKLLFDGFADLRLLSMPGDIGIDAGFDHRLQLQEEGTSPPQCRALCLPLHGFWPARPLRPPSAPRPFPLR